MFFYDRVNVINYFFNTILLRYFESIPYIPVEYIKLAVVFYFCIVIYHQLEFVLGDFAVNIPV